MNKFLRGHKVLDIDRQFYVSSDNIGHWSSTESNSDYAWYVSMYGGGTYDINKRYDYYVRAVSAF